MHYRIKKTLKYFWFKPYTPLFFLALILFLLYEFAYPPFQKAFQPSVVIKGEPKDEESAPPESAEAVVEAIQKFIDLPQDEQPEVVTITDIEKFKDQPFFKKAQNGDKLLLYKNSKKAILFNPRDERIIDVAPITDASESAKQLADYCAQIATQSAQIAGAASSASTPTPSGPAANQTATTPSPTEGPTPTPTP